MKKQKLKISYKAGSNSSYETDMGGLPFTVTINGKKATGAWRPRFKYVTDGVDINELRLESGIRIKIFSNGGGRTFYQIRAELFPKAKQPKNLRFTGKILSVDNLKNVFIEEIKSAYNNKSDVTFTPEFLKYFEIEH